MNVGEDDILMLRDSVRDRFNEIIDIDRYRIIDMRWWVHNIACSGSDKEMDEKNSLSFFFYFQVF